MSDKPSKSLWNTILTLVVITVLFAGFAYAAFRDSEPEPEPCTEFPSFAPFVMIEDVSSTDSNVLVEFYHKSVTIYPYSETVTLKTLVKNEGQCPHNMSNFDFSEYNTYGWYLGGSVIGDVSSTMVSGDARTLTLTIQQVYTLPCPLVQLWQMSRIVATFGFDYDPWTVTSHSPCDGPGPVP